MKTPPLGFTLVELLISLTILALLIGAGLPGLQGFVANNKADNQYRQLFTLTSKTALITGNMSCLFLSIRTITKYSTKTIYC